MQLVNRPITKGEDILNHSTMEVIVADKMNTEKLRFGVVGMASDKVTPILGYFEGSLLENVIYMTKKGYNILAINAEILGPESFYSKSHGVYLSEPVSGFDKEYLVQTKGLGGFPYEVARLYESYENLNSFNIGPKLNSFYKEEYKDLFKYTFGIEYETSRGYIPQEECYKSGLIPLRDGSISGVEYASIVLSKEDGFERVKRHTELLKEYTDFNTDCSYHIHMGGFPLDSKSIFILYTVWGIIEEELRRILPDYAFDTHKFKSSGKNYCKPNPGHFRDFGELYRYLSEGALAFSGALDAPHPSNEDQSSKWRIRERYWAQNIIGMCFYDSPKTVEYRMLAPSYSPNKIIFWLYVFNAIMIYAEKLRKELSDVVSIVFSVHKKMISLKSIFLEVYPLELAAKMIEGLNDMESLSKKQKAFGDFAGAKDDLDDNFFKSNIIAKKK